MTITKYNSFIIAAIILILSSCKKDFSEDYNRNVYGVYQVDFKSRLSGAIANFSQNGGLAYMINPQLYVQYQSQNVYTNESRYSEVPGAWGRFYANQIKPLTDIINAYSGTVTSDMEAQGYPNNMLGVAKIFRAIVYKRVADYFGAAPLSEAVKMDEGIRTPKYDTQEDIYDFIVSELKAGRDLLNPSGSPDLLGDLLFNGNMNKWGRLANSVLLQASLQLSKIYPAPGQKAAVEFNAALNNSYGVLDNVSEEPWFKYSVADQITNPLAGARAADFRLSRELTSSMRGLNDNFNRTSNHTMDYRLAIFAQSNSASALGLPYGYSAGGLDAAGYSTAGTTTISTRFRSQASPLNLFTVAYTRLMRAEAGAIGWTEENALDLLEKGIHASYQSFNMYLGGTDISGHAAQYAAARVVDAGNASIGLLKVIREEKWVALFNNGADAWAEWRRTGTPDLLPAPNAVNGGAIPRRMNYPAEEANFNRTNYEAAKSTLIPADDKNTSRIWWDKL